MPSLLKINLRKSLHGKWIMLRSNICGVINMIANAIATH